MVLFFMIYGGRWLESDSTINKKLYKNIVDYFFPKELLDPSNMKMNRYLCFQEGSTCCHCAQISRYYGTCCVRKYWCYHPAITKVHYIYNYATEMILVMIDG